MRNNGDQVVEVTSKIFFTFSRFSKLDLNNFGLLSCIYMSCFSCVSNSQGRNLGRSVCLLELPVCLAQKDDLGESSEVIFTSQSN